MRHQITEAQQSLISLINVNTSDTEGKRSLKPATCLNNKTKALYRLFLDVDSSPLGMFTAPYCHGQLTTHVFPDLLSRGILYQKENH